MTYFPKYVYIYIVTCISCRLKMLWFLGLCTRWRGFEALLCWDAQVSVGVKLDLPQVAVVGSQSSGKSSVLEGLVCHWLYKNSYPQSVPGSCLV
jgi:hypothetical protein